MGFGGRYMTHDAAGRVAVAVLYGGRSAEHDVSCASAVSVLRALSADRYDVVPIGLTRDGHLVQPGASDVAEALGRKRRGAAIEDTLTVDGQEVRLVPAKRPGRAAVVSAATPDDVLAEVEVVLPILHGPFGEDGTVQGALELLGVPYVGSGVLGSAVAMDKVMSKRVFASAGLPVGAWMRLAEPDWRVDPDPARFGELGLPVFVKPANLGSSVGVSRAVTVDEIAPAVEAAFRYDDVAVVEAAIEGRELECGVLGGHRPSASVVGEICVPEGRFYDYDAKYVEDIARIDIPADLPVSVSEEIRDLACCAFTAVSAWGMARVDFFYDPAAGVFVNEVNTIPGFTSISMFAQLWEASGVSYPELLDRLIDLAFERHAVVARRARH
jgi:D-alanine-D-alanine ligase